MKDIENLLMLIKSTPEFIALKNSIENNDWHHEEATYDHSLRVLSNAERIAKDCSSARVKLLVMSALLHDIAKPSVIRRTDGRTKCPDHEALSAEMTEKILRRLAVAEEEIKLVSDIIGNHDVFHDALSLEGEEREVALGKIKKDLEHIYPELLIQSYADTLGSYLETTRSSEYEQRINFYKHELSIL